MCLFRRRGRGLCAFTFVSPLRNCCLGGDEAAAREVKAGLTPDRVLPQTLFKLVRLQRGFGVDTEAKHTDC